MINHAVQLTTKYKPYPAYKPSGVEWLGNIPIQWQASKIKYVLSKIISGGTPDTGNYEYWSDDENGIPWVAIGDISKEYVIKETKKKVTEEGLKSKKLQILPAGTLIYSIFASLGKVALLEFPAITNQAILGLIYIDEIINQNYLRYWLNHLEGYVIQLSSSNTQDNLNSTKVKKFPVCLPPKLEQRAIADFLDRQTAKIDALIDKVKTTINRLHEYRTALISAAVTGKIDVRNCQDMEV